VELICLECNKLGASLAEGTMRYSDARAEAKEQVCPALPDSERKFREQSYELLKLIQNAIHLYRSERLGLDCGQQ
jgi:hypothetical protein